MLQFAGTRNVMSFGATVPLLLTWVLSLFLIKILKDEDFVWLSNYVGSPELMFKGLNILPY